MDTQALKQYKVLIIGDSCTDVYFFGSCERLSPEAPVPILKNRYSKESLGMSGNVWKNMESISNSSITYISNQSKKIQKIRFIDEKAGQHLLRHDIEEILVSLKEKDLPPDEYDAVLVSDYDKGYVTENMARKISKKYSCPIFVDTKKKDLSVYKGCLIKINEKEFDRVENYEEHKMIVTLGSKGARYREKIYKTDIVEVCDVTGAGDVFISSLVTRWLETEDMICSIKTANRCAAFSVIKTGTYRLSRAEYEDLRV